MCRSVSVSPPRGAPCYKVDEVVPSLSSGSVATACAAKELQRNHSTPIVGSYRRLYSPFPQMLFPELWQTDFSLSHPTHLLPFEVLVCNVFFTFSPPHSVQLLAPFHLSHKQNLANRGDEEATFWRQGRRRKPNPGLKTPSEPSLVL